jgi:D-alanyl-D-alanine carboxypeptidase/D-alanyl-D-alanine-endopeptidase (penicillin-binding protein 4)
VVSVLSVLALVVAAVGYGGWVAYDRGMFDDLLGRGEADPAEVPPPSGVAAPGIPSPAAVLTGADGTAPTRRGLRRALADELGQDDFGPHLGVLVEDLGAGTELLRSGRGLFVPASTLKILTTLAALELLGPDHRFTTAVVRGGRAGQGGPQRIVLVGGGDPLLARQPPADDSTYPLPASTQQLARRTAATLSAGGTTAVRLSYDDSLFSGPAANPAWEASYLPDDVVTPVSALWVDEGLGPGGTAPRAGEPATEAARAFAAQLSARGIEVRGPVTRRRAPEGAEQLASVESPPLDQVVDHTLLVSDNESAEVLLRHVALAAGRPGSFSEGVAALVETLERLGVDMSRARLLDGSGLARGNRLRLDSLVDALRVAADPAHPGLRAVVSRLPVAGFTGSLAYRFTDELRPQTAPGVGVVRAKTGTLTGVHGLAGVILTRDGAALSYVAIADRVRPEDTLDARAELDDLSAAIAACGCPPVR